MAWTERYCSSAGGGAHDGTSAANAWTLAEAIAGYAAGHRVNMLAGTYANTSTDRTFATSGTTTSPVWFRGYKTTIGDMDGDPTSARTPGTDVPLITFTTGVVTISGGYLTFSTMAFLFTGSSNNCIAVNGTNTRLHRVRSETQGSAGSQRAIIVNSGPLHAFDCQFKAPATADAAVYVNTNRVGLQGCWVKGGTTGIISVGILYVDDSIVDGPTSHGVTQPGGGGEALFRGNTFYNCGGDGIRLTGIPSNTAIFDNIFSVIGGYGINNSTGTATALAYRANNLFHACTSGQENGFGDTPAFGTQADSSSPFVAAGTDYTPAVGSNARNAAMPAYFEGLSQPTYGDIGAVRHPDPAGGGSTTVVPMPPVHGHTWHHIG